MPNYGTSSTERLLTCHEDLQAIFNEVIRLVDNSILCGHRSEAEQNQLFAEGKSQLQFPASNHNTFPSMAVDAAPYPIDWNDRERFTLFAGIVQGVAWRMYREGKISHVIRWGGDWNRNFEVSDNNFDDLPHFELVVP